MKQLFNFVFIFFLSLSSFALKSTLQPDFYSQSAEERSVSFEGLIQTDFKSKDMIVQLSQYKKDQFIESQLKQTLRFIFGPLTYRKIAGEQKGFQVSVDWKNPIQKGSFWFLKYTYKGTWLILKKYSRQNKFSLPLPFHEKLLQTPQWNNCTDSAPEHRNDWNFLWYFWDPSRRGCDHKENTHYQTVNIQLDQQTVQTTDSYPEYQKMAEDYEIKMTFAFGYVEDPANPQPLQDHDLGMNEFRLMIQATQQRLRDQNIQWTETQIYQQDYVGYLQNQTPIGILFSFEKNNILFKIKVVASGRVDQMEIFAKSFAYDHDDFFGWFGHSRVGSGFDANRFKMIMYKNTENYSITRNPQLIYWAGCNSYSYYTLPFFEFKKDLIDMDLNGTKKLDIISNGLPSYFILNATNAVILFDAYLNLENPKSYQSLVSEIEQQANDVGIDVLVNVLGDEDNNTAF